jgi:hypothetical protein
VRTGGADVDHIRAAGARVLAEHTQEIGTLRAQTNLAFISPRHCDATGLRFTARRDNWGCVVAGGRGGGRTEARYWEVTVRVWTPLGAVDQLPKLDAEGVG